MLKRYFQILLSLIFLSIFACTSTPSLNSLPTDSSAWVEVDTIGSPTARHEASLVAYKEKLYLIGGRRINPTDVYDPKTNTWTEKSKTPIELHHFQAVTLGNAIYLVGAMTGEWPTEKPLDRVVIYYPERDEYVFGDEIPKDRRRGGAGAVVHNGKIYLVGGITNGHMNGYQNWLDEYNPKTGEWRVLPDAPLQRDHFSTAVINNKLYAFGGRQSEQAIGNKFGPTLSQGDVFDFTTETWLSNKVADLPTTRAGNMVFAWNNHLIIGGGESEFQESAHHEVEAFNPLSNSWQAWPRLQQGRHGSGFAMIGDYLYTASGCGKRGGEPELSSLERLKLPQTTESIRSTHIAKSKSKNIAQWHTQTLSFTGPESSELDEINPFTEYRLLVEFTSPDKLRKTLIRGFYAADGNAAHSSAESGNRWQVRFTPDQVGEWTYQAYFHKGQNIAISRDLAQGTQLTLTNSQGSFRVLESDKQAPDFRATQRGYLQNAGGYFQFAQSQQYWLKGGTNSPENLLAYTDFDSTYRMEAEARDGEAAATGDIHSFAPHRQDWEIGDPTWTKDKKGKAIIGAINYLAKQEMNSVYFLTLNILGDGKDVWPYQSPSDFTRFDVSKLEQWNILFEHMQAKGLLLHIVIQETENELLLDGGDTGFERRLYLSELISRFAHHPALVWNLGEENGPVHWRPEGQNDAQRIAMANFFEAYDPYSHPVQLHTHSQASEKDDIAAPLLGLNSLDGLSFQVAERETVHSETRKWRELAKQSGHEWLITMDEIGVWHTGATPDDMNPQHDSLRRHALWGHLLGGGAGVEWYFGARFPQNDLNAEDFRTRENLWQQTKQAIKFFEQHVDYWNLQACDDVIDRKDAYCASIPGQAYVIYLPEGGTGILKLPKAKAYTLKWFDPIFGGDLKTGTQESVSGSDWIELGLAPKADGRDWVLLIQAQ